MPFRLSLTAFGGVYSSNITPAPEAGIGSCIRASWGNAAEPVGADQVQALLLGAEAKLR